MYRMAGELERERARAGAPASAHRLPSLARRASSWVADSPARSRLFAARDMIRVSWTSRSLRPPLLSDRGHQLHGAWCIFQSFSAYLVRWWMDHAAVPRVHDGGIERGEDDGYRGLCYSDIVGAELRSRQLHIWTHRDLCAPRRVVMDFDTAAEAASAAERVRYGVSRVAKTQARPRRLLLVVNPGAGEGRSRQLVTTFLRPFFEKIAGVTLKIVETQEGFREDGPLREALREPYDGYLACGGDGAFNMLVNTLLEVYQSFPAPLSHIPAGSTDAVACTLASRAPFASAICTALAHQTVMDYLEVSAVSRGVERTNAAVCICTAGFMADTIALSDSIGGFCRLGPFRDDLAGFLALVRNRSHACDIRYLESIGHSGILQPADCTGAACEHCRLSEPRSASSWKSIRGDYMSVMILNHACKSDKTKRGMLRRAHCGDGTAFLVLVQKCNALRYLIFLLSMSMFGLQRYDRNIVDIIPVVEVEVRGPSAFNVDGELVNAEDALRVKVRHRRLPVYAK